MVVYFYIFAICYKKNNSSFILRGFDMNRMTVTYLLFLSDHVII